MIGVVRLELPLLELPLPGELLIEQRGGKLTLLRRQVWIAQDPTEAADLACVVMLRRLPGRCCCGGRPRLTDGGTGLRRRDRDEREGPAAAPVAGLRERKQAGRQMMR